MAKISVLERSLFAGLGILIIPLSAMCAVYTEITPNFFMEFAANYLHSRIY